MTTSRTPVAFALTLLTALGTFGVSCSAIFAPRDDVQRCGTADDCDPTGDARYLPVCKFDDANVDLDTSRVDKVCVADFKPNVGCDPMSYTNPEHPFRASFDVAADSARYASCDPMTQLGTLGCAPSGSTCNDGLAVNDVGLCDDDDPGTPKAVAITDVELPNGTDDALGHEVRDQFCRSFFCDDRFVCDLGTNFCIVCDESQPYGQGGCGEIFIAGARSCIYEDGGACEGSGVSDTTVTFGTCGA